MKLDPNGDARAQGGIDLATIQRYVNYWFSYSLDLFGSEVSSNAADYFASSLKGRWQEDKYEEHTALNQAMVIPTYRDGRLVQEEVPLRNAMNECLRSEYVEDCERVMNKWNRIIRKAGLGEEHYISLPSIRFHRRQGIHANHFVTPEGELVSQEAWEAKEDDWLPTPEDRAYVHSLMQCVTEPGKVANWIAAPRRGINGMPIEYQYVRN